MSWISIWWHMANKIKTFLWNKETKSWQIIICDIFYFIFLFNLFNTEIEPRTVATFSSCSTCYLLYGCVALCPMSLSLCTCCTVASLCSLDAWMNPSRTLIGMYHPPPLPPLISSRHLKPWWNGGHSQCCQLSPRFFGKIHQKFNSWEITSPVLTNTGYCLEAMPDNRGVPLSYFSTFAERESIGARALLDINLYDLAISLAYPSVEEGGILLIQMISTCRRGA